MNPADEPASIPSPMPSPTLRRVDILAMLLCAIVGLDTLGSVSANGPQGLVWLAVLGLLFFAPYGLLIAELGSAFPDEGGPYVWAKLAFGRFVAGINQVFYWISNPVWLGGSLCIVAITTFETFFHPLPGAWKYVAGAVFLGAAGYVVHASLRIGRWVALAGAAARIVLFGFFVFSLSLYAVRQGIQPQHAGDYAPTFLGLVALAPVIVFNFMGFEVPSGAAWRDEESAPRRARGDPARRHRDRAAVRAAHHGHAAGPARHESELAHRLHRRLPRGLHRVRRPLGGGRQRGPDRCR